MSLNWTGRFIYFERDLVLRAKRSLQEQIDETFSYSIFYYKLSAIIQYYDSMCIDVRIIKDKIKEVL